MNSKKAVTIKTYNRAEVDKLFTENSLLIGSYNVVPLSRAAFLFGDKAVEFAKEYGADRNSYGLGKKEGIAITYLYKQGFYKAATYYNIRVMQDEEKGV